ncbi:MAG TPA: DUF1698 domain-containing protein [bacterium]|nr:DUF1698 domain-containing protein [bacterium]
MKLLKKFCKQKKEEYQPSQEPPKSLMSKEEVIRLINSVPFWWHKIEVGYGLLTPGHQGGIENKTATYETLLRIEMPENLNNKRVLDIGAWDGYFSFEAEKRGASEVLAIDSHYRLEKDSDKSGFEVAKKILASNVKYQIMDVYDISNKNIGYYDVVLFLGVLYHLKHPLLALEKIAEVTKELMILETFYVNDDNKKAVGYFYEKDELNKDSTNWWGFNKKCIEALLRTAGFNKIKKISERGDRIVYHCFK